MQDLVLAFAAITGLSAAGFAIVAVLWLRKLRETVSQALAESTGQQVQTAQRFSETVAQLQKRQRGYEQQLQNLAQANSQLRQGLVNMASQLQNGQADAARVDPTIH
jgi:chromosome segregation ATPase